MYVYQKTSFSEAAGTCRHLYFFLQNREERAESIGFWRHSMSEAPFLRMNHSPRAKQAGAVKSG